MKKIGLFLLGCIYFPLAFLWSIIIGIPAGMFFKFIAAIEDARVMTKMDTLQWKRYPSRYYMEWIIDKWKMEQELKKNDTYDPPRTQDQLERDYPVASYPLSSNISIYVITLMSLPFRMLAGLVYGPQIVLSDAIRFWKEKILGKEPEGYDDVLQVIRDFKSGKIDKKDVYLAFEEVISTGRF